MIVCVCAAVCERHLEAVVRSGATTVAEVQRQCGAAGDCGACRPEVEKLIARISAAPARPGEPSAPDAPFTRAA